MIDTNKRCRVSNAPLNGFLIINAPGRGSDNGIAALLRGAALGAASGAVGGGLADYGINDDFMKELAASLQPGNAALFVEIRKVTGDKVLDAIKGTGGVVLKTSLDHTKEQALRDAIAATPPAVATPTT